MKFSVATLCLLLILQWTHARQEHLAARHQLLYFPALHAYPAYHVIKPQQAQSETKRPHSESTELPSSSGEASTSVETQSSTKTVENTQNSSSAAPKAPNTPAVELEILTGHTNYTPDEFPHDLLEIARSKLGLKSLDEVPSISELAEFLGTANAEETIQYIRQMTNTEQGIALITAYLESADFTDRTEETRHRQQEPAQGKVEADENAEIAKNKNNFLDRIAAYFHIYNLWPQSGETDSVETRKNVEQQLSKYIKPQLEYRKRLHAAAAHHQPNAMRQHKPVLVRNPLPYHYPVPLRPVVGNRLTNNDVVGMPPQTAFSPVHLNTPKFYMPSTHLQLARATNIPPQQLQTLLQSKPKLAELAAKVSHLPLTSDRSTHIDAQLMAAVKRAIEQDEDLRKLLQSTAETLK
ncbi:uncharacterized protein LOC101448835 [Ceratitis capitata]|uniref:uncharacterized protein LOC101448835 n=1 Tax=Ceratitis capitata TaxID=7213 RepID=UPI00032A0993|nr:uncharacterized protein LOC101448835 [Ceratitis capitata]